MITKDNLTILIQGKLHRFGLENIPNYLKFGKVVVSTSNNQNLSLLDNVDLKTIKLISHNTDPEIKPYDRDGKVDNDGNVYFQCESVLEGLKNTDTEYVIKVRCDEKYTNLEPFIRRMESGKIVSGDRFARCTRGNSEYLYHLGDCIFGGSTITLTAAFTHLKKYLEMKYFHDFESCGRKWIYGAEQKIYISIIRILEPSFQFHEARDIMKKHFDICPLNSLGNIIVNSSGWPRDLGFDGDSNWNPGAWNCISDIQQI